ncbi:MAG: DUF2177 family protein [Pseudomonadota bacterium]
MTAVLLYFAVLVPFLAIDAVWLRFVMLPIFERHIGPLMAETPRYEVAAIFYLFYIAGVVWFAAWPGLKAGAPLMALGNGVLLGLLAYGTYEATNMATLRGWSWQMVITDTAWGAALTGIAAALGVLVLRAAGKAG